MDILFNIGDTFQVITHGYTPEILEVKCVPDDPYDNPSDACTHCIFHRQRFDCNALSCKGCHFEPIERKEVE